MCLSIRRLRLVLDTKWAPHCCTLCSLGPRKALRLFVAVAYPNSKWETASACRLRALVPSLRQNRCAAPVPSLWRPPVVRPRKPSWRIRRKVELHGCKRTGMTTQFTMSTRGERLILQLVIHSGREISRCFFLQSGGREGHMRKKLRGTRFFELTTRTPHKPPLNFFTSHTCSLRLAIGTCAQGVSPLAW